MVWTTVPNSAVPFISEGGPLLIVLDLWVKAPTGPQYFSCRPMVDDRWAGEYGGYPVTGWPEGVKGGDPALEIWYGWEKSRVYLGIPAGNNHTLSVQCMKAYQHSVDIFIGNSNVAHSVSVIELH